MMGIAGNTLASPLQTNSLGGTGMMNIGPNVQGMPAAAGLAQMGPALAFDPIAMDFDNMPMLAGIMDLARSGGMFGANHVSGFTFTISNGRVTAMQEVIGTGSNSHTLNLSLPSTATFAVSGNSVVETLVQGNAVETRTFVQTASTNPYVIATDNKTFIQAGSATTLMDVNPNQRDKFTIDSSGHVTQVQAVGTNGTLTTVPANSFTSYAQLAPGFVEKSVSIGAYSYYDIFHDGNGDGVYTAVAHGSGSSVDLVGLRAQLTTLAMEAVL